MNSTNTTTDITGDSQCNNIWSPIIIIVLQAFGIGVSSLKYYLGNRNHVSLLDSIKKAFTSTNLQTEQVQLNIPEHLKGSILEPAEIKEKAS